MKIYTQIIEFIRYHSPLREECFTCWQTNFWGAILKVDLVQNTKKR